MTPVRRALWASRWPLIALDECIRKVDAAPEGEKAEAIFALPCKKCPESGRCLTAKRKEIGPHMYDRELRTRPRSGESSFFPEEAFAPCLRRGEYLVPYWHKPWGEDARYSIVSSWDLAWSEKIGGDYMVKMTTRLDRETGRRRVLDLLRVQGLTFTEQVQLIEAEWLRYRDDVVVLEADAAQVVWLRYMGDNTAVPVLPHKAGGSGKKAAKDKKAGVGRSQEAGKTDFVAGVPGLLMQLEARLWEFPWTPGGYHHEHLAMLLVEAEAFGMVGGKMGGVGEHDDTVLAWWHNAWACDRLMFGEAMGGDRS